MGLIISEGGVLSWFFYVICGFALGSARPDLDSLGLVAVLMCSGTLQRQSLLDDNSL